MKKYKIIIIGAGPAGLSTALNFTKNGERDVLVLEKYRFPRYKCCAGYITKKTKKEFAKLGLDLIDCHYSLIDEFNLYYKNKKRQTIINKFMYTNININRTELDNALFLLTKKKGIKIVENAMITEHDRNNNIVTDQKGREYQYDYLVFADGTSGFGSKYQKRRAKNIAIQMHLETSKSDSIDIHFGMSKSGYGWVSTKNGKTNIGLTDKYNKKVNYKELFENYLKTLGVDKSTEIKGAFTPIGIGKPIINKNIYYVGDALGACDPLTLSGVRYGLKSGEKCAKSIVKHKKIIYRKYCTQLKCKLTIMSIVQRLFYLKSTLFLTFDIGTKYFGKVITKGFNYFMTKK